MMRRLLLPAMAALLLAAPLEAQHGRGIGRLGGFHQRLGCPPGSKQVRLPGQSSLHCVMEQGSSTDQNTQNDQSAQAPFSAFAPVRGPISEPAATPGAAASSRPAGYEHIMRPGIEADLPRNWHLTDAWKDDVPTLYLEAETGREGKQVTMVVSRIARGQDGYLDMSSAISREKQLRSAKDGRRLTVGGLPARTTYVSRESQTVYVSAGGGTY